MTKMETITEISINITRTDSKKSLPIEDQTTFKQLSQSQNLQASNEQIDQEKEVPVIRFRDVVFAKKFGSSPYDNDRFFFKLLYSI